MVQNKGIGTYEGKQKAAFDVLQWPNHPEPLFVYFG